MQLLSGAIELLFRLRIKKILKIKMNDKKMANPRLKCLHHRHYRNKLMFMRMRAITFDKVGKRTVHYCIKLSASYHIIIENFSQI